MLTPKQKAEEIYMAMYNSTSGISKDSAKKCAIEAVKELMERDRAWCEMLIDVYHIDIDYNTSVTTFNEVIQEIEKIPVNLRKSYQRRSANKS